MSSVLIVGSGGREHALAWKLAQSSQVTRIIVAPGNAGMPEEWERWPVSLSQGEKEFKVLAIRARQEKVNLVIVGPDNPLADGIVNVFEAHGVPIFGPTAEAARIEASKSFAKEVMQSANIPTAQYWTVHSKSEAQKILKSVPWPHPSTSPNLTGWVIKADGLAFGKGVYVCETREMALQAVEELFKTSEKVLIEERLQGEEISWMAFCDGERCSLLEPARDYKRLLDLDQGPNTGGMGAFSPVGKYFELLENKILESVFIPVLQELRRRNSTFRGLLYAGLMVNPKTQQFWVLEFNARFGDPEAQVLLPRMEGDLYEWCEASARGDLSHFSRRVPFKKDPAVFVVAAARGYPQQVETGMPIEIDPEVLSSVFYSGVSKTDRSLVTAGGRVFGTLGMGSTLELAREKAYKNLEKLHFEGIQYRSDIGRL